MVADQLDSAVNRNPVGMYIDDVHEDGDHQTAVMEVFIFVYFLYYHDLAVGRSDDYSFRIAFEPAYGTSEEVDHNKI